jgi:uncharacterized membrane protein
MKVLFREITLFLLVVIPLAQLYYLWPSIPDVIPVHYGLDGKADRFDNKSMLIWLVPLVLLLLYGILALVPRLDPKKRVNYGQGGYYTVRLASIMFLSVIFISYFFSLVGDWNFSRSMPLVIMAFITVLGNYLPVIKPNYFIGVRTPWTLENEQVWTATHRFSGRLWVAGGLIGFLIHILWPDLPFSVSVSLIGLLAVSSVAYSYLAYRNNSPQIKD